MHRLQSPTTVNLIQNIAMIALTVVAARSNMNGAMFEQYAALIGGVAALLGNHVTVSGAGTAHSGLPNGLDTTSKSAGASAG